MNYVHKGPNKQCVKGIHPTSIIFFTMLGRTLRQIFEAVFIKMFYHRAENKDPQLTFTVLYKHSYVPMIMPKFGWNICYSVHARPLLDIIFCDRTLMK